MDSGSYMSDGYGGGGGYGNGGNGTYGGNTNASGGIAAGGGSERFSNKFGSGGQGICIIQYYPE